MTKTSKIEGESPPAATKFYPTMTLFHAQAIDPCSYPELNVTDLSVMTNKINCLMIRVLTASLTDKAELNIKT